MLEADGVQGLNEGGQRVMKVMMDVQGVNLNDGCNVRL